MGYPILIGCTKTGCPIIGAKTVRYYEGKGEIADTEHVYGIQIGHRCTAHVKINGKYVWRIMTWTQAKEHKATLVHAFAGRRQR